MKTRDLYGMSVIEFRADTQRKLFRDIGRWLKGGGSISSISVEYDEDTDEEYAVVTYA